MEIKVIHLARERRRIDDWSCSSLRLRVRMSIITIMAVFSNVISPLYLQSRGIKLKIHNCVISNLLCTKYEAPKLVLMLGALRVKKPLFVTSHFHTLRCITLPITGEPYFTSGFNHTLWLAVL